MKYLGDHNAIRTAYYALFDSRTRYGIVGWGGSPYINIERLLVLQKRAVRIIVGLTLQDICRKVFKQLEIMYNSTS